MFLKTDVNSCTVLFLSNCVVEMAGKSGKSTGAMQDVEGYIHNVSPIKTPASGNRYFDFKIQERVDTTHVVCFHPDKRETLKQKEAAKSPVRIVSVSPQKGSTDQTP